MIKLDRIRNENTIAEGLRGAQRKEKAVALVKLGYQLNFDFKSKDFQSSYWKSAKPQMELEAYGKCAYCEAPTNAVAHGDVEHFRPKTVYWWLAYCYENYSYSCQICNQTHKGNKFKIFSNKMTPPQNLPATMPSDAELENIAPFLFPDSLTDHEGFSFSDFKKACEAEDACFIDPYLFNPEPFFKWEVKTIIVNGELKDAKVEIAPRDDSQRKQNIFIEAKENLGLNREELCVLRWDLYENLITYKETLDDNKISVETRQRIKNMLKKLTSPKSAFTAMARYFVHEVWKLNLD
jgi:uncharacterized protein (TIGR02646 family)